MAAGAQVGGDPLPAPGDGEQPGVVRGVPVHADAVLGERPVERRAVSVPLANLTSSIIGNVFGIAV
ncbi:hypothetical protein PSA01_26420 [Pseudonocardia saturnea]|uniref:Uncharacterized protein n=1 Tax=Pseudonocardia saturnea TaxID=33909 RepID=A0ABQ0RY90_9PSEU|nr:hypothetical protein Pdca_54530 [Pseudonocardia autotrophica]GEC25613.1 hypothetical protein PSA01_26420 [Pseudonocardia saturnea]